MSAADDSPTDSVSNDPDVEVRRRAAESLADGDPTGWFDRLYVAAEQGDAVVPWDRGQAHPLLCEWVSSTNLDGTGKRALVVGCGKGWDAELIADLGYATTAFDVSPAGVEAARKAHPGSVVDYQTADLLNPPADWHRAFDLVVEIFTVQALPPELQATATQKVVDQVALGGTLLVIAAAADDAEPVEAGPPWPLTRESIKAFAAEDVQLLQLERLPSPTAPDSYRWRAEFLRR